MLTLAIGEQLRIKAFDGGSKPHNYLPELMDLICHMNGYIFEDIKSIMRTISNISLNVRSIARIMASNAQNSPDVGFNSEVWSNGSLIFPICSMWCKH